MPIHPTARTVPQTWYAKQSQEWRSRRNISLILSDIDYIIPLITYLGMNPYWWARSAPALSAELALDEGRVRIIFDRYPMIFRKSLYIEEAKSYSYALQMRYARRDDGKTGDLPKLSGLPPLTREEIIALIDFLVRISTLEKTISSTHKTIAAAALSALITAMAIISAAYLKPQLVTLRPNHSLNRTLCGSPSLGFISLSPKLGPPQSAG